MDNSRTYYGYTFFNKEGTQDEKNRIKLMYYSTKETLKEESETYGIEIVKKEYENDNIKEETSNIKNVTNSLEKVIDIIKTLQKYKVTPIGLNDVMEDLKKIQEFN